MRATSLTDLSKPIVKKAMGKSAPAILALLQNWSQIAPREFQYITRPVKIRFPKRDISRDGNLDLDVQPEAAFIVQHSTPKLINAINLYFGYPAIAKINMRQTNFLTAEQKAALSLDSQPEPHAVVAQPAIGIKDPGLAQSLANLAASVASRNSRKR